MSLGADVVAAGAVIARRGGREVLLVHRPKYDDWSFPKGKQDPGEHVLGTATREVWEETGLHVHLGRPLPPQFYDVSGGRSKVVNYWVARLAPESADAMFVPNPEVDELRWFSLSSAAQRLSYLDDVEILDAFRSQPRRTAALVIMRHAAARKRSTWSNLDTERPLAREGRVQAAALRTVLGAYGVNRVHTSPSARCAETVEPYATAAHLDMIMESGLSEERADSEHIGVLLDELLAARESAVVCSHRPVLPEILDHLGIPEEPLAPAEFVVCHHRKGRIVAVERHLTA
ncbi:MAG TPA: NUDIX domain-containing protein [Marmoricola sp.]|nr:NUDIX domain-containing protein [Marmoricola sp.]